MWTWGAAKSRINRRGPRDSERPSPQALTARCPWNRWRNSVLSSLPVAVCGRASTNTTSSGNCHLASLSDRNWRTAALEGKWRVVYDEIKQMKEACGKAHMKAILAVGELGSMENVYKASFVAMMAGSDFIKTSTGKEGVNATFVNALVMVRAIRDYHNLTGYKVGFKPAGGIRTAKDSCVWLSLMKEELGDEWTTNKLFRLGASALLGDIERQVYHYITGRYAAIHELP